MRIVRAGLVPYAKALWLQQKAVALALEKGIATLFVLEHPPVITYGRNGGEENLPFGREFFASRGVEIVSTNRGGNITCHFPGQLVAYPVMRVDRRTGGLRRFFF